MSNSSSNSSGWREGMLDRQPTQWRGRRKEKREKERERELSILLLLLLLLLSTIRKKVEGEVNFEGFYSLFFLSLPLLFLFFLCVSYVRAFYCCCCWLNGENSGEKRGRFEKKGKGKNLQKNVLICDGRERRKEEVFWQPIQFTSSATGQVGIVSSSQARTTDVLWWWKVIAFFRAMSPSCYSIRTRRSERLAGKDNLRWNMDWKSCQQYELMSWLVGWPDPVFFDIDTW